MSVRLLKIILVFSCLGCLLAGWDAKETLAQPRWGVGYRVIDLDCQAGGEERRLTVAVWYPTVAQPTSYHYGGATTGTVAVDAVPDGGGGPYPLLVFSHGYGGSGLGAVFLSQALAASGWIVACPDHHDSYSAVRIRTGLAKRFNRRGLLRDALRIGASGPTDRGKYLYRLDEMERVLDGMLDSEGFGKLIDRSVSPWGPFFGRLYGTEAQFAVIRRYSIAFLEQYVAGRKDSAGLLEQGDPMLTRYVAIPETGGAE